MVRLRRRRVGGFLGSLLVCVAGASIAAGVAQAGTEAPARPPQDPDPSLQADIIRSAPYVAAIRQYRLGQAAEALDAALAWEDVDVKVAAWLHVASTSASPIVVDVEAAILLHTQASLEAAESQRPIATQRHLIAAFTLLGWVDRLDASLSKAGGRSLERAVPPRDWFLATLVGFNRLESMDMVGSLAEEAVRRFPKDADIQLAAGAIDELRGPVRRGRYEPPALVTSAMGRYRAALAADANCHEAAVRLGRMLSAQGFAREAERLLGAVIRSSQDVRLRYLAQLFLGGEFERQNRRDEAVARYTAAVAILPQAQAARTALAHLVRQTDRVDDARAVVEPGLDPSASRTITADPYWAYGLGPMLNPVDIFDRMVTGVRR